MKRSQLGHGDYSMVVWLMWALMAAGTVLGAVAAYVLYRVVRWAVKESRFKK